jgi:hydroxymethylpyrimidine pyrophosphatase-like HAD family hydrolase
VICCHGALTKDFGANRTLVHLPLALQYAKPMVEYAETHGLSLAIYSEETFYRLEGSRVFMDDMTGPSWREAKTFADVLHEAPTFVRFLGAESVRAMAREFGDWPLNFRYETWGDFYECAVLNREASKKTALARLCADFQIVPERVLAIGDSRNDVPMLRWAGVGVAMGNALPEVKESVRYVTASNTDDGVARAIERFVGIPAKRAARDWERLRDFSRANNEIPDDVFAQPQHFWEVMLHKLTCGRIDLLGLHEDSRRWLEARGYTTDIGGY